MKPFGIAFGKSGTKAAPSGLVAPGTLISYDPQLIEPFADHHQELLAVVAKLRMRPRMEIFRKHRRACPGSRRCSTTTCSK